MRSWRSLKVSHTQTSVPCGMLNNVQILSLAVLITIFAKKYIYFCRLHCIGVYMCTLRKSHVSTVNKNKTINKCVLRYEGVIHSKSEDL